MKNKCLICWLLFACFVSGQLPIAVVAQNDADSIEQIVQNNGDSPESAADAKPKKKLEMADGMRSSGLIYVVVGVILIILIGLLVYLFTIDKKVEQLEKELKMPRE